MITETGKEKPAPSEKDYADAGATGPAATSGDEIAKDTKSTPAARTTATSASTTMTPPENSAAGEHAERDIRSTETAQEPPPTNAMAEEKAEAQPDAARLFAAGPRPTATSRPTPTEKRASRLAPVLGAVLTLLALAVIAYFTRPYWSPYVAERVPWLAPPAERLAEQRAEKPPTEDSEVTALQTQTGELRLQLATLSTRLDTLQADIRGLSERLDTGIREAGGADEAVRQLSDRMAQLSDRVAQLEATRAAESKQDTARLDAIEKQIAELAKEIQSARQGGSETAAAVLAVSQLGEALRTGSAYATELASLKALAGDDAAMGEAVAVLEPRSAVGVPTLAALRARFPEVSDAVVRAETSKQGESWIDKAVNRLTSLVIIRRTGSAAAEAGGTDAALAAAEEALASSDLAAAADALARLRGAAAEAAAGWLADARARLTAEQVLASLQSRAIARLTAARG